MTLLRQGRSGSALLDQLVAEAQIRRQIFCPPRPPTIAHRFRPPPPPPPLPNPKTSETPLGIYREPHGRWVWRVRLNYKVIARGACDTAEEAHLKYCAARGAQANLALLRKPRFRPRPLRGEPKLGPPPKIRTMGCLTVADIQRVVAWYFGWSHEVILESCHFPNLVRARQIAMYLSKVLTTDSYPKIGRMFGGRDHTTVIYAVRRISDAINGTKISSIKWKNFKANPPDLALTKDIVEIKEILK
jgi:hypothetical protein